MKQSKDPFEVAAEEQEEPAPDSPVGRDEIETQPSDAQPTVSSQGADMDNVVHPPDPQKTTIASASTSAAAKNKNKEDDDEEEEENMDVELGKVQSSSDPDKMAKMQYVFIC